MVGYRFGNLIIRRDVYYPEVRRRRLYVSCDICNEDTELFPDMFITDKQRLEANNLPCGCSKSYRWKHFQYLIRIGRKCKESDLTIFKVPERITSSTKITLKLPCGKLWETFPSNFLNGTLPRQYLVAQKSRTATVCAKYSTETLKVRYCHKAKSYFETCLKCVSDKDSMLGCRTEFKTNSTNLKGSVRMCRCNGKHHRLEYEWVNLVQDKIKGKGGTFVRIVAFDKYKTKAMVYYLCNKGTLSSAKLDNLYYGDRWCSCCRILSEQYYLYITFWDLGKGYWFAKFGITSHKPSQRSSRQRSRCTLPINYYTYRILELPSYKDAKFLEDKIKNLKLPIAVSRREFPDGYTETFIPTPYNLDLIEGIISETGFEETDGQWNKKYKLKVDT